jgi:hypothetical protein
MVDIVTLSAGAISVLAPYLKKGVESIASESGKGLWKWISEKFKKGDREKDLEALKQKPDDARLQGKAESILESILRDNPTLVQELVKLMEPLKDELTVITNSKNVNTGTIRSKGNVIIGDKNTSS